MSGVEQLEAAWDLRISNPKGALASVDPLLRHPDPEVRAQAHATAAYATLRIKGPEAAEALLTTLDGVPVENLGRGRLLVVRGAIHLTQGHHPEAIRCFRQGGVLLEAVGQNQDAVGSLINIASVYRRIGDAPRALALITEAVERFRGLSDPYGESAALISSAQLSGALGDLPAALPLAERSLSLARTLDRPGFLAFVLANLGRMLADSGDIVRGLALLEEALAIAEDAAVPQALSEALGHLGMVLLKTSPEQARGPLERAYALVRDQGDSMTICMGLIALGDASEGEAAYRHYADAAALANQRAEHTQATIAHRAAALSAPDRDTALTHWRAFSEAVEHQQVSDRSDRLARLQVSALLDEMHARDEAARQRITMLATAARRDSDLLAITIHDLRNPLQVARGYAELLAYTNNISTQEICQALTRIEQILQLVEAEILSQKGSPAVVEDLLPLLEVIVRERRLAAEAKQQHLRVEGASVVVPVHADRLFHAVDNLISNALKFSPQGSTVTVRLLSRDHCARIEVHDQGPGLSPEDAAHVFEREYRGGAHPTGGERSSGMGLYIARRMVERHGGRIGATPTADGALFWIELPR
ncbi:MAG: signal transduction histidine kinase [Myxococcota bacterium]|jgi:signal transduction histidine kinase